LCGSGPAFMYLAMEALCEGAVQMGLPFELARECAAQVLVGSGEMVLRGDHPAVLKSQVCTPAGTTIAGLAEMEDRNVRSALAHAVKAATKRAKELSDS
jgi:pyrroline-5-carboxylate reductase